MTASNETPAVPETPDTEPHFSADAFAAEAAALSDPAALIAELADQNARHAAEAAEAKDKVLRTLAEMENLRRRTQREVEDAKAYGVTNFARDLLSVTDNLRRALETLSAEARAALDPAVLAVIEGVEMTERELLAVMERHGVKKLDPVGQKFDPNLHQAMFEIPDTTQPNGTVVQVVQTGYIISGRVLRPAMVGVTKGGPKDAPAMVPEGE
jgi:molecular chaperone GrpE